MVIRGPFVVFQQMALWPSVRFTCAREAPGPRWEGGRCLGVRVLGALLCRGRLGPAPQRVEQATFAGLGASD